MSIIWAGHFEGQNRFVLLLVKGKCSDQRTGAF